MSNRPLGSIWIVSTVAILLAGLTLAPDKMEAVRSFRWMGLSTYGLLIVGLGVPSFLWGMFRRGANEP